MANFYVFTTKIDPDGSRTQFTPATSGGTITGASGAMELVYDGAKFTGAEGRVRLINAVSRLRDWLEDPKTTWPLS